MSPLWLLPLGAVTWLVAGAWMKRMSRSPSDGLALIARCSAVGACWGVTVPLLCSWMPIPLMLSVVAVGGLAIGVLVCMAHDIECQKRERIIRHRTLAGRCGCAEPRIMRVHEREEESPPEES